MHVFAARPVALCPHYLFTNTRQQRGTAASRTNLVMIRSVRQCTSDYNYRSRPIPGGFQAVGSFKR